MTQIKPLKNVWVVVNSRNNPMIQTIADYKYQSIACATQMGMLTWGELKACGWKCVKVNLEIKQV
jgi:hypothetical protein